MMCIRRRAGRRLRRTGVRRSTLWPAVFAPPPWLGVSVKWDARGRQRVTDSLDEPSGRQIPSAGARAGTGRPPVGASATLTDGTGRQAPEQAPADRQWTPRPDPQAAQVGRRPSRHRQTVSGRPGQTDRRYRRVLIT